MVSLASLSTSSLCDAPINHAVTNLLLAVVVHRFNAIGEHRAEKVILKIIALQCVALITCVLYRPETRGEIPSFFCQWRIANQLHKAIAMGQHRSMKAFARIRCAQLYCALTLLFQANEQFAEK